ncbi:GPN-loop GTPase 3 [Galdieria sulphuraria]|nr:GPN-loop GTPase 3 [Galdieria sulphuraria]
MGPAGCGKSTYCFTLQQRALDSARNVIVVNLDPAAENYSYSAYADIRELISVEHVEEELTLGPNGALVYCMEYLLENFEWLEEILCGLLEDDYVIFDCPGQIELYTHYSFMRDFTVALKQLGFQLCGVYLLDSQVLCDPNKYLGGCLSALSTMLQLEIPHVNILTKMDLVKDDTSDNFPDEEDDNFICPDMTQLLEALYVTVPQKFYRLNQALSQLIEDYSLTQFIPLNIQEPESISFVFSQIDQAIQYGEDAEVRDSDILP